MIEIEMKSVIIFVWIFQFRVICAVCDLRLLVTHEIVFVQKVQIVVMHDAELFTIVDAELYIFFLEPKLGIECTRQRLWIGALYFALFCNTLGSIFADPIYHTSVNVTAPTRKGVSLICFLWLRK